MPVSLTEQPIQGFAQVLTFSAAACVSERR
jgi:hypothetical protein